MHGQPSKHVRSQLRRAHAASLVRAVALGLPAFWDMTLILEATRRPRTCSRRANPLFIYPPCNRRAFTDAKRCWRTYGLVALLLLYFILGSDVAFAHVKWFCAYDVAEQPIRLSQVISGVFGLLVVLALIILFAASLIDVSPIGTALHSAADWVTKPIRTNTETLLRGVYGAFFIALWARGGIILTPELTTAAAWISWLQLSIAAGMLWRSTLPLSGVGIVVLFGVAVFNYGLFHLLDYPIFLGAAAYFILVGTSWSPFGVRPLDVARYATAVTLMWASVEKWAYPQWSYPIFIAHPQMSFGFDVTFYMKAAGVVEFALAFALAWTPLARAAALVLCGMFVSAIFEFGKIDAIGHAPIIVILLAVFADQALAARHYPALAPAWCAIVIAAFIAAYYIGHALLFGTAIV